LWCRAGFLPIGAERLFGGLEQLGVGATPGRWSRAGRGLCRRRATRLVGPEFGRVRLAGGIPLEVGLLGRGIGRGGRLGGGGLSGGRLSGGGESALVQAAVRGVSGGASARPQSAPGLSPQGGVGGESVLGGDRFHKTEGGALARLHRQAARQRTEQQAQPDVFQRFPNCRHGTVAVTRNSVDPLPGHSTPE
jgi:hypothetical protein